MQHFRVKVFAKTAEGVDLHAAIPVFHRWIQKSALPELLIDVADYQHVPNGPGVMLVGHDSHYGLDQTKGRLGLLYTRRTVLAGSAGDRIRASIDAVQTACRMLENEPEYAGKLAFDYGAMEISVNDRGLAPNTPESYAALAADVAAVLGPEWKLTHVGEPRELLTVSAVRG